MARKRPPDLSPPLHRSLSTPAVFLARMAVFVTLTGLIAAILSKDLLTSFMTNPFLNGMIIAILLIGVFYMFAQVLRLYPEIRWVNGYRIADPGLEVASRPRLLAPMATLLRARTGSLALSTGAMRTIMDSIASRLDEARDTGRYLVGLLVFLGLLGTFWGLLDTIQSVGRAINALDTKAADSSIMFEELKNGLAGPLKGMGTAFSASLLGLAGSLILGFLDLQASQAHNRFYNELEEWLSGITDLSPDNRLGGQGEGLSRSLYMALGDLQRSIDALTERVDGQPALGGVGSDGRPALTGERRSLQASASAEPAATELTRELAQGVNQLVGQLRSEQTVVRQWLDDQSSQAVVRHDDVTRRIDDVKVALARNNARRAATPGEAGE
jgi:hypothetical protein